MIATKVKSEQNNLFDFGDIECHNIVFLDALLGKLFIYFLLDEVFVGLEVNQQALFELLGGHGRLRKGYRWCYMLC